MYDIIVVECDCNNKERILGMYLIVGLGNPEEEYANTRHNMGFCVINKLAQNYNIEVRKK